MIRLNNQVKEVSKMRKMTHYKTIKIDSILFVAATMIMLIC